MTIRAAATLSLLLATACVAPTKRAAPPGPPTPPPAPGQAVAPPPPAIVGVDIFGLRGTPGQGALLTGTAPRDAALLMLDGQPVRVASDGRFIIAFGRDAGPSALLEARMQDGRLLRLPLAVAPRAWDISSLPIPFGNGTPSAAFQRVRAPELAQIAAAKAANSDSDGWRHPFAWPARGRISTLFGSQRIYQGGVRGQYHGGLDIARYPDGPAIAGTPAVAPADGVVTLATDHPFSLEGNLVMIDHGFGLISSLMHLQSITVHGGDHVRQGQEIGLIGATGRATGPHLHWGMTWKDQRIDPLLVVGPMPERR